MKDNRRLFNNWDALAANALSPSHPVTSLPLRYPEQKLVSRSKSVSRGVGGEKVRIV